MHPICESDSQVAIKLVKEPLNSFHLYASIILRIKDILMRDWEVEIHHIFREGNMLADLLAKKGAQGRERLVYWEVPPQDVKDILLANTIGFGFRRG